MHAYDNRTGVIFFSQVATNAIACWNTAKPLRVHNIGIIARDDTTMIYPADINVSVVIYTAILRIMCDKRVRGFSLCLYLQIDADGIIWVMTNALPLFNYAQLNPSEFNYRIWTRSAVDAIRNTVCDLSSKTLNDLTKITFRDE